MADEEEHTLPDVLVGTRDWRLVSLERYKRDLRLEAATAEELLASFEGRVVLFGSRDARHYLSPATMAREDPRHFASLTSENGLPAAVANHLGGESPDVILRNGPDSFVVGPLAYEALDEAGVDLKDPGWQRNLEADIFPRRNGGAGRNDYSDLATFGRPTFDSYRERIELGPELRAGLHLPANFQWRPAEDREMSGSPEPHTGEAAERDQHLPQVEGRLSAASSPGLFVKGTPPPDTRRSPSRTPEEDMFDADLPDELLGSMPVDPPHSVEAARAAVEAEGVVAGAARPKRPAENDAGEQPRPAKRARAEEPDRGLPQAGPVASVQSDPSDHDDALDLFDQPAKPFDFAELQRLNDWLAENTVSIDYQEKEVRAGEARRDEPESESDDGLEVAMPAAMGPEIVDRGRPVPPFVTTQVAGGILEDGSFLPDKMALEKDGEHQYWPTILYEREPSQFVSRNEFQKFLSKFDTYKHLDIARATRTLILSSDKDAYVELSSSQFFEETDEGRFATRDEGRRIGLEKFQKKGLTYECRALESIRRQGPETRYGPASVAAEKLTSEWKAMAERFRPQAAASASRPVASAADRSPGDRSRDRSRQLGGRG